MEVLTKYTSFPVEANGIMPYKLHLPRDHVEANEIVQHSKLPMYVPFLTGIKVELHALHLAKSR